MIKSAAGAASYLTSRASRRAEQDEWLDGIIDGAGLAKQDPRLQFRRVMLAMARKQAGQVLRRRDTREHVALYLKAFNAWRDREPLTSSGSPHAKKCPGSPSPAKPALRF
jgi:hypothetical protein